GEDGIRDCHVTGVQTCALPILPPAATPAVAPGERHRGCCPTARPRVARRLSLARRGPRVAAGRSRDSRLRDGKLLTITNCCGLLDASAACRAATGKREDPWARRCANRRAGRHG